MTIWRPPLGVHLGFEVRDIKRRDPEGPRASKHSPRCSCNPGSNEEMVRFDPSDNLLEGLAQRRHFPLGCLVSAQANAEPSELEWGHSRV